METALLIMRLVSMAVPLILQLEKVIVGAKQGAVKKDAAVSILNGSLDLAASAGMKPEQVAQAKAMVPAAVEVVVTGFNVVGLLKGAATVIPEAS